LNMERIEGCSVWLRAPNEGDYAMTKEANTMKAVAIDQFGGIEEMNQRTRWMKQRTPTGP
jgi:hypothetical protein